MKAQHTPLKEARIVFYGAGSSAVGVATMIAQLISKETGIPFDEAKKVPNSAQETRSPHARHNKMPIACHLLIQDGLPLQLTMKEEPKITPCTCSTST
jgi:malic enzyme